MKSFAQALQCGPQIGLLMTYPAPGIIERIGPDWDWVWIDGQHGQLGYSDILAMVRAANLINRPALVRVPGHEGGPIGKVLDTAADAIMVPLVDNADQAAKIVQGAKFPPLGSRSFGGRRPIDRYTRTYAHPDRPGPMLVCQIETRPGLDNIDAIAAVPGVDALFFGPDDMALRDGLAMDTPRREGYFDDALNMIAKAAQKHGKIAGGIFTTPPQLRQAIELGYRLITGVADVGLLAAGSKTRSESLRAYLLEPEPTDQGPGRPDTDTRTH